MAGRPTYRRGPGGGGANTVTRMGHLFRTRSTARRSTAVVAVVLLAAAVVGACSSADEGGSADATTSSVPRSTTTAAPLARYAGYESAVYADPAHWICRPDQTDVCDSGLDATEVAADGTLTPDPWHADPGAPIDCFYVYPTISADKGDYSDLVPGDEERFVTQNQAARLGSACRVFAPVYRQRTLAGLTRSFGGASGGQSDQPYQDVLDAWRQYMAHDSHGRGVVLIGHSQGAGVLTRLLQQEVDPNPDVRDHLVAAYLAGTSLAVPEGKDVGGALQHVPLCRAKDQTGCVVTWASFRSTSPPPADALFGKSRGGVGVAGCTNPAALAGGPAELHSYFAAASTASILSTLSPASGSAEPWVDPSKGAVQTPFVTTPGLVTGECVSRDGRNYLEITVHGDPADPRRDDIGGDLTPQWGLHLQDVNLVMGDVVDLVGSQSRAWRAAHD